MRLESYKIFSQMNNQPNGNLSDGRGPRTTQEDEEAQRIVLQNAIALAVGPNQLTNQLHLSSEASETTSQVSRNGVQQLPGAIQSNGWNQLIELTK